MEQILAAFLIVWSGWTLATHLAVAIHLSLSNLIVIAPFTIAVATAIYVCASRMSKSNSRLASTQESSADNFPRKKPMWLFLAISIPLLALAYSWVAFWLFATIVLCVQWYSNRDFVASSSLSPPKLTRGQIVVTFAIAICAILWTLSISRSDLDDAMYVATAAYANAHPHAAVLQTDPMFGESNWPLIFPSYRFATYEVLGAAIAHLTGATAMSVMYRVLPVSSAVFVVIATLLLARELSPRAWVSVGIVTFLMVALLGEYPRGQANFAFIRLFQGKAVFVSAMLPALYYLTWRFMRQGRPQEWVLLLFAQFASIGLSNFGMLIAPLAVLTAALANWQPGDRACSKRLVLTLATLLIPVPYLATVALQAGSDNVISRMSSETASDVWRSVFGNVQQYLIALLLLGGALLPMNKRTRYRLLVPPLVLLLVLLNPLFSNFISKHITTPPVYWRVTWVFPVMIFIATSLCELVQITVRRFGPRHFEFWILIAAIALGIWSAPLNSFTSGGSVRWAFAQDKVDPEDYAVAKAVIEVSNFSCRVLANDEISGMLSEFEIHPRLINVRRLYLELVATRISEADYRARVNLYNFLTSPDVTNVDQVRQQLHALSVGTVVLSPTDSNYQQRSNTLKQSGFELSRSLGKFEVWIFPMCGK
jgi:hypothetical protein